MAVERVRTRSHDENLGVDVLRGIGFRAVCPDCGPVGKVWHDRLSAKLHGREHRAYDCPQTTDGAA